MIHLLLVYVLSTFSYLAAAQNQKAIHLFDSIALAKSTIPAVVDVYAYRDNQEEVFLPFDLNDMEAMLFGAKRYANSSGTGCVISADGIIVTCNHVIQNANRILIGFNDGKKMQATKIFANAKADIAFLKVDAKNLPFLVLADPQSSVDLGEKVLVAGNAFGMGKSSIFDGLISFTNRVVDGKVVLQSNANIGVGNSGGPMVNSLGQMIGMAFAIPRLGGLSFFIRSGMISYYYNKEILKNPSPWWGVQVQSMSPEMIEGAGLKDSNIFGVTVVAFTDNSPAAKILHQGDVIVEVNGQKLSTHEELDYFEKTSVLGQLVNIKIWRDGKLQDVSLSPEKEPESIIATVDNKLLGNTQFEQKVDGVVVQQSEDNGLFQEGDKIIAINNIEIKSIKDIDKALKKSKKGLSIVVNRNGAQISQAFSGDPSGSFFSQRIIAG